MESFIKAWWVLLLPVTITVYNAWYHTAKTEGRSHSTYSPDYVPSDDHAI